ncbi:TPA: 30S ribosomal protein S9 [Candidatus Dependentiae bacterium]|nr:MAG: 30S ribosomal protein S9 [candidate division TM6 bacterium GW2011_GWE2_31_21]KKP54108.1 MAG: 30S ribosomal protein S9 [candidate division TM6 bacterium GW2011_GWF2_33_332]HBS48310.1 30S ribosomal protein S9 [Candidatus Dependentiae bacterium]HBZ73016.1 30S ribosomal protein S9 [Candidatus Dependentiae bacterium]
MKGIKTSTIHHGVGRRKSAVARVWLKAGKGNITVNGLSFKEYFDTDIEKQIVVDPMNVARLGQDFDIDANVQGGGLVAQAGAVRLGLSRALVEMDETLRSALRKSGFLTCDARVKERKKYGQKAARRKFQFVKR